MFNRRCPICDWPMAETRDDGCVEGDCSYRPREGSEDWNRMQQRKKELADRAEVRLSSRTSTAKEKP